MKNFLFLLKWHYKEVGDQNNFIVKAKTENQAKQKFFEYLWWHYIDQSHLIDDEISFKNHVKRRKVQRKAFMATSTSALQLTYNEPEDYKASISVKQVSDDFVNAILKVQIELPQACLILNESNYLPFVCVC